MTGVSEGTASTHNDQFFTGKAVTVDLSTGGSVKLKAATGYGGEKVYDVTGSALRLHLSNTAVEPVQVINMDPYDPTYNLGTHVAANNLDFSNVEQNMGAYVAEEVDAEFGAVNLGETRAVAAGDAFVMLADEPGWYCIPVGGNATYTVNKLKGNLTQSTSLDNTKTYYALHKNGEFVKLDAQSVASIPAGTAYIEIAGATQAGSLWPMFMPMVTGINAVASDKSGAANYAPAYNMAGQRVGAKYKGLIIVNGKKYMNK